MKSYHEKCQSLEMDKASLKKDKNQLKLEVSRLKEQLDTVSIASHGSAFSLHKGLSHSLSSLHDLDSLNVRKYILCITNYTNVLYL